MFEMEMTKFFHSSPVHMHTYDTSRSSATHSTQTPVRDRRRHLDGTWPAVVSVHRAASEQEGRVLLRSATKSGATTGSQLLEEPSRGAERCDVVVHLVGLSFLDGGGEARGLVDGALRVELGGEVGAPDLEHW